MTRNESARLRMYWFDVAAWLDHQLKLGRRALYRAARFDLNRVWHRDGSTVHQRVSQQLQARRVQLEAVRGEMARVRERPRMRMVIV